MGTKYEILSVTYSATGFRDNRNARFLVRVTYPNGKHYRMYYESLPDLRKLCVVESQK